MPAEPLPGSGLGQQEESEPQCQPKEQRGGERNWHVPDSLRLLVPGSSAFLSQSSWGFHTGRLGKDEGQVISWKLELGITGSQHLRFSTALDLFTNWTKYHHLIT